MPRFDAIAKRLAVGSHVLDVLRVQRLGLGHHQQLGFELRHRNGLADIGLDVRQAHGVQVAGEADRVALFAQPRGAADAVHVVLGILRQVVVEHVGDVRNVQPARGDVGGHQVVELAILETLQKLLPLELRHVARNRADPAAVALHPLGDALGGGAGVDENDRALGLMLVDQIQEQRHFFFLRREIHHLAHLVGGHVVAFGDDLLRVMHVLVGQLQHAQRQRGGEQQHLALLARRQAVEDVAHVLDEAEVEHAVGFVDHHHLDAVQAEHALFVVVEQAPRRGDDDVAAVLELLALLVVIDAAVDQRQAQAGVRRKRLRILVDLDRQLAGGSDHQRARVAVLALGIRRVGQQVVHQRDQECAGLAGAGLRLTCDIAAGERHRQSQFLDRGAAGEPGRVEALLQQRVQVEAGKEGIGEYGLRHESGQPMASGHGTKAGPAPRDQGGAEQVGEARGDGAVAARQAASATAEPRRAPVDSNATIGSAGIGEATAAVASPMSTEPVVAALESLESRPELQCNDGDGLDGHAPFPVRPALLGRPSVADAGCAVVKPSIRLRFGDSGERTHYPCQRRYF